MDFMAYSARRGHPHPAKTAGLYIITIVLIILHPIRQQHPYTEPSAPIALRGYYAEAAGFTYPPTPYHSLRSGMLRDPKPFAPLTLTGRSAGALRSRKGSCLPVREIKKACKRSSAERPPALKQVRRSPLFKQQTATLVFRVAV
jgi:hypothetical protein